MATYLVEISPRQIWGCSGSDQNAAIEAIKSYGATAFMRGYNIIPFRKS
ncbi:hypothetical protein [Defluviimonas sp. SAOS-178_SWC]